MAAIGIEVVDAALIAVREGARVEKNALLVQLETRELKAAATQARGAAPGEAGRSVATAPQGSGPRCGLGTGSGSSPGP